MIGRGKDSSDRGSTNGRRTSERSGNRRPQAAAAPAAAAPGETDAETSEIAAGEPARGGWTFLTNHAHVLACIAQDHEARVREIALRVGITERAVLRILGELDEAGVITRTRAGRRTRYAIEGDSRLRHPVESHRTVGELLALLAAGD